LIAQGENVKFVSRMLGHADAATTLRVYAHAFDRAEQAARAAARLERSFGTVVEHSHAFSPVPAPDAGSAEVVEVQALCA
jgi:hypothetical protein